MTFRLMGPIDSGRCLSKQSSLSDNDGQLLRVRRVKVQFEQPPAMVKGNLSS